MHTLLLPLRSHRLSYLAERVKRSTDMQPYHLAQQYHIILQAALAEANREVLATVERENLANLAKRAGAAEMRRAEEQRCM